MMIQKRPSRAFAMEDITTPLEGQARDASNYPRMTARPDNDEAHG
jgi:hypothetical protein